jgi:hypothetical protein
MSRRNKTVLGVALVMAALLVATMRVATPSATGAGIRLGAAWAMGDFRNTVYYPVRAFLEGGDPYDRADYRARYPTQERFPPFLPSTLVIHAPFGLLPPVPAALCYAGVAVLLTFGLAWLAFRHAGGATAAGVLGATGLILLSRPGQWNLLLGQVTLQVVLACHIALHYARRVPWVSGLALGFSTFKPTFGVPLAALMLARGDTRAVAIGTAVGVVLNLPVVLILSHRAGGVGAFLASMHNDYVEWTGNSITGHRWSESSTYNPVSIHRVDFVSLASRFIPDARVGGILELLVTMTVFVIAALVVRRLAVAAPHRAPELSAPIICVAVLMGVYHLSYDLLLLVPFLVALVRGREVPDMLRRGLPRWILVTALIALAANYASTQAVLERLGGDRTVWLLLASVNPLLLLVVFASYVVAAIATTGVGRVRPASGGSRNVMEVVTP